MAPFVELRKEPIGNTFLDFESAAKGCMRRKELRLARRHSFSHISDAHASTDVAEVLREAARRKSTKLADTHDDIVQATPLPSNHHHSTACVLAIPMVPLSVPLTLPLHTPAGMDMTPTCMSHVSIGSHSFSSLDTTTPGSSPASSKNGFQTYRLHGAWPTGPGCQYQSSSDADSPRVMGCKAQPKELVRELRMTGSSALERASALAKDMRRAGQPPRSR